MKILSIDQSYTNTGYCVLDESGSLVTAGLISSEKEKDIFDRSIQIADKIMDVALEHEPKLVALEGLAFGMSGNATRDLAGLQFTIVNMLRKYEYKIVIVAPNTVKKVATGKGNAKKTELLDNLPDNIRDFFENTLGAKKTRGLLDLTDAYFIGQAARQFLDDPQTTSKK